MHSGLHVEAELQSIGTEGVSTGIEAICNAAPVSKELSLIAPVL